MKEEQNKYLEIGHNLTGAIESQMFGKPCFKINKKAFVCFFQNEMVFKLTGDIHCEALSLDGSQLFDPSGNNRPMKEWVQVSFNHQNKWTQFAEEAMKYVAGVS
ncbi:MAG: hypothetical protein HN921_04865 [Bacteroidetes bacterium]|jgi:hypothetical protein|nr:hypothetical protein [Bacteroidota bacterium]MBT5529241.1 hypothetical protein [Cytophagia bacterium]MBT3421334.1 hypothetical protein [Bacteroidota bacterium]MBT4730027.1 hypothetical protein [Bacteroidota bacterium]MBT4967799.1 hypothetical protein [Bacteroidota bacterium]